jgi:hypothetical protein
MEDLMVEAVIMGDCDICCERYNLKTHKKVECSFCEFKACRECVQRYLLSTSNDPHCMSCKNAWNREFVDDSCTKTFRNKQLKDHREVILVEREKCLLPQTQHLVAREKEKIEVGRLLNQCRAELRRQRELQMELENRMYRLQNGHVLPEASTKKNFVRKCPIGECRGFLSDDWACGTCKSHVCSKCNELDGEGHECDPNNVETVRLLNRDTKPCPACGTMIFKISGCNQMWCPDCHTAFDWVSGRIETGLIHNPHYYEFQRRVGVTGAGRNLGDIPCGGFPNLIEVMRFLNVGQRPGYRASFNLDNKDHSKILNFHKCIVHVQMWELPQYRPQEVDNSDLRVKYLMNELDEAAWKHTLQVREKKQAKKRDIHNVLTMLVDTSSDYFRQLLTVNVSIAEFIDFMTNIILYFNENMEKIHKRYNCVAPYIVEMRSDFSVINHSFKG